MESSLHQSYSSAVALAHASASSFYHAFSVLPREKRLAMCAVYAFMRRCDDIADGPGPAADKRDQLHRWRQILDAVNPGNGEDTPFLQAFRDTMRKYGIPAQYFHWMIDGVEMDLDKAGYQTFDELYHYCFHVASSVGLVCLQIFGYSDEKAKKYAEYCGIAFQLTNILRDIREDASLGRTYLPAEDLQKFGYSSQELRLGIMDSRYRRLMAFEAARAQKYYSCARNLLPLTEKSGRPALWAMMEIYGRLLRKIVLRGFDVFGSPIRLSRAEKSSIAARAILMRYLPWAWPAS